VIAQIPTLAELQQSSGEVVRILDKNCTKHAKIAAKSRRQGKKMKRKMLWATAIAVTLAACGGGNDGCTYTPLLGEVGTCTTGGVPAGGTNNGTGATAKLLVGDYAASRIAYDSGTDQLIVESLPFDDDVFEGRYDRVAAFDVAGYKAYRSTNGLDNYIAYYGTSSTGNTSSAIVAQDGYADHGHAGAGYARTTAVNLPSTNQKTFYTGSYVGLRTVDNNTPFLDIISADLDMEADFSDNKVRGFIRSRVYKQNQSGTGVGSNMALTEGTIDRTQATVSGGGVSGTVDGVDVDGNWVALFGGPNGKEIAGVVVITHGDYRETGSIVAEQ